MRVGAPIFNQNYGDWDRYEAAVRARMAKGARSVVEEIRVERPRS